MQVNLSGSRVSDKDAEYVREKVEKLSRYFNRVEGAKVELNRYRSRKDGKKFRVEVTVDVAKKFVRGEEYGESIKEACDLAVAKAEKQLKRYKTRIIDKNRQSDGEEFVPLPIARDTKNKIARVKHFKLKPMSEQEAVMQMDLSGHDFYVFSDQSSRQFNVLYRRSNGTLGLLVPEE